jgi:hypothetical protein
MQPPELDDDDDDLLPPGVYRSQSAKIDVTPRVP